jgi:oligopeptide/dipeptide ABC transporter ATP-binding protein
MRQPLLDIRALTVQFHTSQGVVRAVDGVDIAIQSREVVGLVGESGCGKSTIAHAITRLIPSPPGKIMAGEVLYQGSDLLRLPEAEMRSRIRGREIAMVFQDPMTYLNPVMKVRTQLTETLEVHQNLRGAAAARKALELLERVQIPSPERVANSYPHELSGGMRQRVLIGMAISCNPRLLIADEPTTALDVTVQAQILRLLKGLVGNLESSLLLITHDLGIVAELCDRVYVIYCGKVVEHGDVYGIFEAPTHPYTMALLRSALSIEEMSETLVTIEGQVPNLLAPPPGCAFHPRCPYCMDICRREVPVPVPVGSNHDVWCFRDLAGSPKAPCPPEA